MVKNILIAIWNIMVCGIMIDLIILLGSFLWHILFDRKEDDGTHITRSIRKIWEDEDEN